MYLGNTLLHFILLTFYFLSCGTAFLMSHHETVSRFEDRRLPLVHSGWEEYIWTLNKHTQAEYAEMFASPQKERNANWYKPMQEMLKENIVGSWKHQYFRTGVFRWAQVRIQQRHKNLFWVHVKSNWSAVLAIDCRVCLFCSENLGLSFATIFLI